MYVMAKLNKYGIKFPFNVKSLENTFVDMDCNEADSIKSQLMHLIFTPVGQRLRKPLFGSRLIQFVFNPNDSQTWGDVVSEIKEMVKNNIPNCNINNVYVYENENGLGLVAELRYSVSSNGTTTDYKLITKL